MRKKYLLLVFLLSSFFFANAQKEFWGLSSGLNTNPNYGSIYKTDFDGTNFAVVHYFDFTNGRFPFGRLFQASNGKLYGTASLGGAILPGFLDEGAGVLFEYDLILDRYKVLVSFMGTGQPTTLRFPQTGVIEPLPGILYGSTNVGGVFKYTIATQTIALIGYIPPVSGGSISNPMYGEYVKASNGFVYGTTQNSSDSTGCPFLGSIVRTNPTTDAFNVAYLFTCGNLGNGRAPSGSLVEGAPGKLFGTTRLGGYFPGTGIISDYGILFEFDIATNTYTKKIDFDLNTIGAYGYPLSIGENNKLYGTLGLGNGTNVLDPTQHYGSLYEYDIPTNTITVLHYFDYATQPFDASLLKSSTGFYVGINRKGIYKFDPITNEVTQATVIDDLRLNGSINSGLIEICRKPSYHFFDVDTFDACVGSTFTYDIQNTNATSYQWLKNNVNVVGQTTAVLNLTNLTTNDAGNYTCLMTNECGTTTTMVLHLTVSCLGTNTVATLEKGITIYPNPAKNILNLKLPENINVNVTSVTIANSLGQIVLIQKTENTTTIDVSNLQKGIYIVSLSTNYGSWNGKFLKE